MHYASTGYRDGGLTAHLTARRRKGPPKSVHTRAGVVADNLRWPTNKSALSSSQTILVPILCSVEDLGLVGLDRIRTKKLDFGAQTTALECHTGANSSLL